MGKWVLNLNANQGFTGREGVNVKGTRIWNRVWNKNWAGEYMEIVEVAEGRILNKQAKWGKFASYKCSKEKFCQFQARGFSF
jgi:hypothetical protein